MSVGKIAVVGAGYVGLVAGACFSSFGYEVGVIEINPEKLGRLQKGEVPIYEPGLSEIIAGSLALGNLSFFSKTQDCLKTLGPDIVILAVGTPANPDGSCNLSYVNQAVRDVAAAVERDTVLVIKSTVPVGTARKLKELVASLKSKHRIAVVNNPEFLKEGSAISDFMRPERVVLGGLEDWAIDKVRALYNPLLHNGRPLFVTDHETAELAKLSANLMLASRVSLINQVSRLSSSFGADVRQIEAILRSDSRIGNKYLYSGLGYGGSCFPKDVKDFIHLCEERGVDAQVAKAIDNFNESQKLFFVDDICKRFKAGSDTIGLLGVAFKPETDDIRESPALALTSALTKHGFKIKAHDPKALGEYRHWLQTEKIEGVELVTSAKAALEGTQLMILHTEWQEYQRLGLGLLPTIFKGKRVYDGKNVFRKEQIASWGFEYMGVGR
ncbi:MAG TPA: UDP-glucose/GDP-mannose dehydrogenase family protein [Bdellovibrionota bacterium]|jgi:UDPglucose 6-dehydrogenase|nr:UDP-glucose/GDP-mannose dehydrogenase family protein [Bdellovibrionota bacterium]